MFDKYTTASLKFQITDIKYLIKSKKVEPDEVTIVDI